MYVHIQQNVKLQHVVKTALNKKKTICELMQKTSDYTSKNQKQKFINKTKRSLLNVIPYQPPRTPYE